MLHYVLITTIDIDGVTASNTAPTSVFAITNSIATLPNYHTPDTAQLMIVHPSIAHPSIAHPLIVLSMLACQKMVQPGTAYDGATCDAAAYDGAAFDDSRHGLTPAGWHRHVR
mgnify:CR=1 FL=1